MTETVEAIYRAESRRVLATLIRLLGDFDLAEEALHDAFKAVDAIRRRARFQSLDAFPGGGSSSPAATRPWHRTPR